jgi:uncharacterized membrane protein YphA (DoxX/SURF4 family)
MKINEKLSPWTPLILRLVIAYVFIWFGWSCVSDPASWSGLVPDWTHIFGSAETLVLIHGVVEIICAILLIVGFKLRWVSAILFLILLDTVIILGSGPAMARDIGLLGGIATIWFWNSEQITPERRWFKRNKISQMN